MKLKADKTCPFQEVENLIHPPVDKVEATPDRTFSVSQRGAEMIAQTTGVTLVEAENILGRVGSTSQALIYALCRIQVDRPLMHELAMSYFLFRGLQHQYALRSIRPTGSVQENVLMTDLHKKLRYSLALVLVRGRYAV